MGIRPNANLKPAGDVPAFILVEESIARFGHDPRRLKPGSTRMVVTVCDDCGKQREKGFRYAMAQRFCISCSSRRTSSAPSNRRNRSVKMKAFFVQGGRHPLKGGEGEDFFLKEGYEDEFV